MGYSYTSVWCVSCWESGSFQFSHKGKKHFFSLYPYGRTKLAKLCRSFHSVLSQAVQPHTVTYSDVNKPEIKKAPLTKTPQNSTNWE